MKRLLFLLLFFFAASSCNKLTKYSNTPKITFNSMSIQEMKQGTDTNILVSIDFQDGDGDIGFQSQNLFFIDPRDTDTIAYSIPTIPDRFEPKRGLSGTLQVEVLGATLVIKDTANHPEKDTLIWKIFLKDAAGNQSNEIVSKPLILTK